VTDARDGPAHGPQLTDTDRLLMYVRRMNIEGFARVFRRKLPDVDLMRVITALPKDRLDELTEKARTQSFGRQPLHPDDGRNPLAGAILSARIRAGMGQHALAKALGVRQSSVSQWERGVTKPSGLRLVDLMRELPALADALSSESADEEPQTSASSDREAPS